jgi:hypothetical protein
MYARTSSRVGRWRDRKWACLWPRCVPDLPIAGDRVSSLAVEMPRLEFAYGRACRRQDSPPRHVGRSGKEIPRSMSLMSATGAWSDCGDRRPWTDMTVCCRWSIPARLHGGGAPCARPAAITISAGHRCIGVGTSDRIC